MAAATKKLADQYIEDWKGKGYGSDIPDSVPPELMKKGLAPSYQAIALAILNNDLNLKSLGFQPPRSEWYGIIKRIEIKKRERNRMDVGQRIKQLRDQGATWPDVAKTLNEEGAPSPSGKPWSNFMVINYGKSTHSSKSKQAKSQKPKSELELRLEALEKRLIAEIHRGVELEAKLAAAKMA